METRTIIIIWSALTLIGMEIIYWNMEREKSFLDKCFAKFSSCAGAAIISVFVTLFINLIVDWTQSITAEQWRDAGMNFVHFFGWVAVGAGVIVAITYVNVLVEKFLKKR